MYRLPRWCHGKEPACQFRRHRRHGFNAWVGKIPWEEQIATRSSVLAWKIPWTEEPGRQQSTGHRELDTNACMHACPYI